MGKMKKVRQHINPLKNAHMQQLKLPPHWPSEYFARPEQPLHVDIGSARGLFCLDLASVSNDCNVLGLEIRAALADAAAADARQLALGNAAFLACNANTNFDHLMSSATIAAAADDGGDDVGGVGLGRLRSVSIQFPDPWFKTKHHKRRVVQPELCRAIAHHLQPGGWLFMQSDVLDLARSARKTLRESTSGLLVDERDDLDDWSAPKPAEIVAVATERERAGEKLGRPCYRMCFRKPSG